MAFKRAAVLALAAQLPAAAAAGGLRGLAANGTAAELPGENATLPQVATASTGSAFAVGNLTEELLAGNQGALQELLAAPANQTVTLGNLTTAPLLAASGQLTYYWDGQCYPYLPSPLMYPHCWSGGTFISARQCANGGWEGHCVTQTRHGQPAKIEHPGTMRLYHMTSPEIAQKILAEGFRPGSTGYCGGAIYFYGSPNVPRTKLGPNSHYGAVIEAHVNMGSMAVMDHQCDGYAEAFRKYDSIRFNPGDGNEYAIATKSRITSVRRYS